MPEQADSITCEHGVIDYVVVRSKRRRKTLSLTVDEISNTRVSVPMRTSRRDIQAFVKKHASWIVRARAARRAGPPPMQFNSGETIPYLGRQLLLEVVEGTRSRPSVHLEAECVRITAPAGLDSESRATALRQALVRWYREQATEHIVATTALRAAETGLEPKDVRIRDQRRRWGSCSRDGTLRFNWRLVMMPPELVDYVVVHELCHLRVPNHSATFWSEVARFMPAYIARRTQLNRTRLAVTF